MKYPLDLRDVTFVAFRCGQGPGGQNKNKVSTSIRATHEPTGVTARSTKERTLGANKLEAIRQLREKLDRMVADRQLQARRQARDSKPDAAFGSQDRTYRMAGNAQCVTDHRTGVTHPNPRAVLDGDLDAFTGRAGSAAGS